MAPQALIPNENLYLPVYLEQVFNLQECQRIIDLGGEVVAARLYGNNKESLVDSSQRHTQAMTLKLNEDNHWLFEKMIHIMQGINEDYYHFQIVPLIEIQRLEYPQKGLFEWHVDLGIGQTTNRKLTSVLFLNDGYDGGELILSNVTQQYKQKRGSMIVFPAYIPHQVKPVIRGVRHTLVSWIYGPPFR